MTERRLESLRLEGVSRSFGGHDALRGLDLTISGGEFVALLGPSGCGKSTALNCIAGLLPLTGGRIWTDDERVDGLPPERRGFGMVFQNYALFPHLTVRRNVAFGLQMAKVSRDKIAARVDATLRLVQLEDQAEKFPGQLSGGQQQRVAIARAIVIEPRLVLMDEPLSNLDAKLRLEMRMQIRRLHQSLGLTTVYVTHDQEEALSMADRLVVLRDGIVQQVGTPEEVYSSPANLYVANFMGYRNMISLEVTGSNAQGIQLTGKGIRLVADQREQGGSAAVGTRVIAAIRPDDLQVSEEPAGDNCLAAVAEIVEYHGREHAVQGRLGDGTEVFFRTDRRLAAGDALQLSVRRDRVQIYPSGDTHVADLAVDAPVVFA